MEKNTKKPQAGAIAWDTDGLWTEHLRRDDQDMMDRIVNGSEKGHYFMLLGPKVGCGIRSQGATRVDVVW